MVFVTHQFPLLLTFFVAGCIGVAFILRKPAGHRAWLVADLVWVVLGLFGALGAVVAGIYTADSSRLERQIDITYAASAGFDRDAARFRLRYCESAPPERVAALCDKVDFLSASTAGNADLPLFLSAAEETAPLQGLHLFIGAPDTDMDMMKAAEAFDPAEFLAFNALDDETSAALSALRGIRPVIAADFQVLAQSYDTLIAQTGRLKREWDFLQRKSWILLVQILSICLVSFAAPFRLGKSVAELRAHRDT